MIRHTLYCDQCNKVIDQVSHAKETLRNGYELRISKNINDDPYFPIHLDLCEECTKNLLIWLKVIHDLP